MNEKETIIDANATETEVAKKENFFKKAFTKTKDFVKQNKKVVIGAAVGAVGTLAGLAYLGSKGTSLPDDDGEALDVKPMDESPTE